MYDAYFSRKVGLPVSTPAGLIVRYGVEALSLPNRKRQALTTASSTSGAGSYQGDATSIRRRWPIPTAWRNWTCGQVLMTYGSSRRSITSRSMCSRKKVAKATYATIPSRKQEWVGLVLPATLSRTMRNIWPGATQISGGGSGPNRLADAVSRTRRGPAGPTPPWTDIRARDNQRTFRAADSRKESEFR